MSFSDFIIYADESGSPVRDGIDPDYPVFVLTFVLVAKAAYAEEITPALQAIKFDLVGHDQIILHERDIRRQSGPFAFLQVDAVSRNALIERLNTSVEQAPMEVLYAVIRKQQLTKNYVQPWDPYRLALHLCLEQAHTRLKALGQSGRHVHCVFESRGLREDKELELIFRRIVSNEYRWGNKRLDFTVFNWSPVFADKKSNSVGLQLADLTARPLGLQVLRPNQPNRAAEIIRRKVPPGFGKVFP